MAATDDFVFFEEEMQSVSFTAFYNMKNKGELSDIIIRVGDRSFIAHRIILAAAIPYFHAMLTSGLTESKQDEVTLQEIDPDALESLINFAYACKVRITSENVQALLITSVFLQITKVRDTCCDFLAKRLDPSNVMEIRGLADSLNCHSLVQICDTYISQHFEDLYDGKAFLGLSFPVLKEIITRNDLKVTSEEIVFDAVVRWVKSEAKRHSTLPELLSGVRLTLLSPQCLVEKASREELIMKSSVCRNLIDEAKHYYLLPEKRPSVCSFKLIGPRKYDQHGMFIFCCNASCGLKVLKYVAPTNTWSTLMVDRTRGDLKHVLTLDNLIYVFRSNSVFESLNPFTLQWTDLEKYPGVEYPMKYIVPCNNRIYWLPGNFRVSKVLYFDCEQKKWCWEEQTSPCFSEGEVVSSGDKIYILNCMRANYNQAIQSIVYDPRKRDTTVLPNMTYYDRKTFGCASLNGSIYVCGGTTSSQATVLPSEVYSLEGQWRYFSDNLKGKKNFTLVAYNSKLYTVGGTAANDWLVNHVECCDPAKGGWTSVGSINVQRYSFVKAVAISLPLDEQD